MNELGPEARELIELAAPHDGPRPGDRERVRRRVALAIGASSAIGVTTAASTATAKVVTGSSIVGWLVVGAGVGLSVAVPAALLAESPREPVAAVVAPAAPASMARRSVAAAPPVHTSEPAVVEAPPEPPVRAVPSAPPADSLARESALLSRAQRELAAGAPERALATLREHQERFPGGALSPERDAARVVALCASGNRAAGRAARAAFLARHPSSPVAPRVRAACGDDFETDSP